MVVPFRKFCLIVCVAIGLLVARTASRSIEDNSGSAPVVRVVTSGGLATAYDQLSSKFEQQAGIELHTAYGSSSGGAPDSIPERLARGEEIDLVILSKDSLERLAAEGELRHESRADLAVSRIGMAVRDGAARPDIATKDSFIAALLDAKSIGYSASASGTYLSTELFPRLGIWEQIEPKSHRILSERVASVVARGEVEIGFQQISEILPIEGADLVGPIPEELQEHTIFSATITQRAKNPQNAQKLIEFLSSAQVAPVIASTGLQPLTEKHNAQESGDYPTKPVTVVVGFGVGGSADRMARAMSSYLADELGQPVQVINKKGAGTLLAANYVLSKPPDGYTLFASSFSPYLSNTILEGNATYTIDDFAYVNFQWFDEDLIALSKNSTHENLPELLESIRTRPKTVRASCVRGSAGHLMAKLLLDVNDIPQESLNLVTYNSGGQARAAVAGGVVDFIVISAKGCESIREYIRPLAIVSDRHHPDWDVPTLNQILEPLNAQAPVLPGSIRGFATSSQFEKLYPSRFETLRVALQRTLENPNVQRLFLNSGMGVRWTGPQRSKEIMNHTFRLFKNHAHFLKLEEQIH